MLEDLVANDVIGVGLRIRKNGTLRGIGTGNPKKVMSDVLY